MASIISSSSNTSLPPSWPSETNSTTTLRDVSFSSYLNSSEEAYIRTLAQSAQNLRVSEHPQHDTRGTKAEDGEIDIFGAERYFNGGIEDQNSNGGVNASPRKYKHHQNQHQQYAPLTKVIKVQQPRTPSCHSESSWNSQSALLRRVQRAPSRGSSNNSNSNSNNNSKALGRRLFLPCYCCDRNSIIIDEQAEIKNSNKIRLHTDPNFVFPVSEALTRVTAFDTVEKIRPGEGNEEEEEGRKSLEVFGSSELDIDGIGSKSFSLERRLNMLSWDAIPRPTEEELNDNPSSGGPPSESYRDDTGSDASSDLFELDCLSCTANPVGLTGLAVGVGPSPTPTSCYAPSEASIEWSVVTASAADFSAISDWEDQRSTVTASSTGQQPPKRAPPTSKPRAATLLGCKSQKAVRVAGEVHKALPTNRKLNKSEKQKKKKYSEEFMPMTKSRFQAEAKLIGGFGGQKQRQDHHVVRSPRWSHSSHASELLYIQ